MIQFPFDPNNLPENFYVSWTGDLPSQQPYFGDPLPNQRPQPVDRIEDLAMVFGRQLGKMANRIKRLEQALIEMQEEINEEKRNKKTRQGNIGKSKSKRKV